MILTPTGWLLVIALVALAALPLVRLRPPLWRFTHNRAGGATALIMPAAVFLLVAGIGAATTSLVGRAPWTAGSGAAISSTHSYSGPDGGMRAGLADYARSIAAGGPAPTAAAGEPLPDVNTMIERLAARLATTPEDVKGWQMLGWSYFHTTRFEQAAAAYAKALEIDPDSAEIKQSYDEARAKAAEGDGPMPAATSKTEAAGTAGDRRGAETIAKLEAMAPHERDAAIRSMVDGLAARLERAPRDVEGWDRLMRSRVALGETEIAAAALRRALDVFKDDSAASSRIAAAAVELGLAAE